MARELRTCVACAQTGFTDKVWRHVWSMEPRDKICPTCRGRGWVERKPAAVREDLTNG